ncbi:coniferyl aldehyde dehydrogenase [Novosphingobium rosa]|uniref:coniferyl aldehyde dehydrogenase n=1 Tax=Novosphingobium rosa TaxID=76978 RepID=UPI00082F71F4|nr:coniferyl aldehyde dehydrogenase [Novosphingobium rosa]
MTPYDATVEMTAIVRSMQRAQLASGPADANLRRDRLARAMALLLDNGEALAGAINADFGTRSRFQSLAADVGSSVRSLSYAAEHVAAWMQSEPMETPDGAIGARIDYQPLGVVGIISPWNFPVNLAFSPLAGVFAAGNTALIKPSELTPRTSELLADLAGRYFSPDELGVVLGDAGVGEAFSRLPLDHLIFTGSTAVGRQVMRAAAENLVPVTLELGGKSPVVIAPDADAGRAAQRVMAVKTFNAGQICLAPDYALVTRGQEAAFVNGARTAVAASWPAIQGNPDYTAIISQRHYDRLLELIADALAKGATLIPLTPLGEPPHDPATRKIAPVILTDVTPAMQVMREEIFGPILPLMGVDDVDAAVAHINAGPRPLAAYYFGADEAARQSFAARTTSGALVFEDVMTHVGIEGLPFGGVGASGIGAYHGIHGFRRFSHARAVAVQGGEGPGKLRAPYAEKLAQLEAMLVR